MDSYVEILSAELKVAEDLHDFRTFEKAASIAQRERMRSVFSDLRLAVIMPVPVDNFSGYRAGFRAR